MTSMGQLFAEIKPASQSVELILSISRDDVGTFLKYDTDKNKRIDEDEAKALRAAAGSYFAGRLLVSNEGLVCPAINQKFLPDRGTQARPRLAFAIEYRCKQPLKVVMLQNTVMFDDKGGYQHLSRIRVGKKVYAPYFSRVSPRYTVEIKAASPKQAGAQVQSSSSESWIETLIRYIFKGGWHIIIGLDHLAFVFCLVIVARETKALLWVITAFTVGHSITLILCVLDVVTLPVKPVEAMIALTIAYVAVENLMRAKVDKPPPYRYLVAGVFGFIHGFGFSYMLKELSLPKDALALGLFGFNVGIELAQVAIVALIYPILRKMMESERYVWFLYVANGLVLAVSLYWFVERSFF